MPKKWNFEQFCAFFVRENFFMGLLVFAVKVLENLQNCIFEKNLLFLKKWDFEDFQGLLQQKLKTAWKNFPGQKMRKIVQKIHFLALEVVKTTSRCFFGQKLVFQKNRIFYLWEINFSRFHISSAWKTFFLENL